MSQLSSFPITARWPASDPSRLQLYSVPTPNGLKVSIALEELAIPYESHLLTLADADVKSAAFTSLNPNSRIPAILDPDGPGGAPLALFESGAILIYLAEKAGRLLGADPAQRYQTLQWLMFQMGGVGPMFGQVGFFYKYAGAQWEDKRPLERYAGEARRLLGVLDRALGGRDWITGEFSIADIAIVPWLRAFDFYGAKELVGWAEHPRLIAYVERFVTRPAVAKALAAA